MNKFCVLGAVLIIVLTSANAFAAGYCPTVSELQSKNDYYQKKAMSLMSNPTQSVDEATAIMNEQTSYYDSLFPNCVDYFKTTVKPDCSRFTVLTTGYMISDDSKKATYKSQITGIKSKLMSVCPNEAKALDYFIK